MDQNCVDNRHFLSDLVGRMCFETLRFKAVAFFIVPETGCCRTVLQHSGR